MDRRARRLDPTLASGDRERQGRGEVIVVDAGHGGRDSGCKGGGVMEKSLTLAIAKYTAAELANLGATVLMTRKDDTYPSLDARSALANRNRADLFISIHINSPGGSSPIGGTEIYYHMKDGIARLLGECIMSGMQQYAKLPNLGVKSDRILYRSGLAVLRNSKMTSVLVEVGFITNSRDRAKMTSSDFQKGTAHAIADGVQKFLGAK
ncbi:N-acetylmuramoyl-L-alanine amidase [bacterium]|nr:MAG: N-acetylmuramoyl-L-alanine amidase [bacterium]